MGTAARTLLHPVSLSTSARETAMIVAAHTAITPAAMTRVAALGACFSLAARWIGVRLCGNTGSLPVDADGLTR